MGARNQVGIELSYRPASLCSLATQFQTRFLESIPRPIAGLKFSTLVYTFCHLKTGYLTRHKIPLKVQDESNCCFKFLFDSLLTIQYSTLDTLTQAQLQLDPTIPLYHSFYLLTQNHILIIGGFLRKKSLRLVL
jgi:hypothetical protein